MQIFIALSVVIIFCLVMDIYQSGIGRIERTVARIIDFLDIFQLAQHLSIAHDSAVDSVSSLDESSADKSLV